jgi:hypothetical protein
MTTSTHTVGRKSSPWIYSAVFSIFVMIAIAIAGCGGGGGSVDTPPPPPPPPPVVVPPAAITVFAGAAGGFPGNIDGTPGRLNLPQSVAVDTLGNIFFIDSGFCGVRKLAGTVVSTFFSREPVCMATTSTGESVAFGATDIVIDSSSNLYVLGRDRIWKISPDGKIVSSFPARDIVRITIDKAGILYGVQSTTPPVGPFFVRFAIYRLNADGTRTHVAGGYTRADPNVANTPLPPSYPDGIGAAAELFRVRSLTVDDNGVIYFVDGVTGRNLRKITAGGVVTTISDRLSPPGGSDWDTFDKKDYTAGIVADNRGNLYLSDPDYCAIRKISAEKVITTIAGTPGVCGAADGERTAVRWGIPTAIALEAAGTLLVADTSNSALRRVTMEGSVNTVAGTLPRRESVNGKGEAARFTNPWNLLIDRQNNLYVKDEGEAVLRKISPAAEVTTLIARPDASAIQSGVVNPSTFASGGSLTIDTQGNFYSENNGQVYKMTSDGTISAVAKFPVTYFLRGGVIGRITGMAPDPFGNLFVIAEDFSPNIRKVLPNGQVQVLYCGEQCSGARGIATDTLGNIYLSIGGSIRRIATDGTLTTLAGEVGATAFHLDGIGPQARFSYLGKLTVDGLGNVFVADSHTIRKVTPSGVVTTVAGTPGLRGLVTGALPGVLNSPNSVAINVAGHLFVASENAIVKIVP